jgi:hypothetical protein
MKHYPFRMAVLVAIVICALTSGCKKDVRAVVANSSASHSNVKVLYALNTEENLGVLNGVNVSSYPTTELDALAWTSGGNPLYLRGLFQFNAIPGGGGQTPPTSAYLTLYSNPTPSNGDLVHANSGTNNAFYIRRVVASWDPNTTTWFNQPATTTSGQVLIPTTSSSSLDLVNIDVTQMVRDMYTTGNYGFMIQLQNETYYNSRMFCSSSYSDVSKRPQLTINF